MIKGSCCCGAVTFEISEKPGMMGMCHINAHCIDGEIDIENQFHEFVADKPAWLKIGDNAQQFEAHPN